MAQEPFSMISPLEQNRKLPKRLVMKVLLYPFFLQSALRGSASVPLHASRTNILTHAHHRSALLLRFSPKNVFFFLLLLFFFSFTLVPADVLSTSNYFCLQKNRDWRVLWAAAVRFTGWENAPKKHNKRELAQRKHVASSSLTEYF